MIARPSLVAAPAVHRDGWPSIYDDPPTALADLDWSTPLFVQAARQAHFDEVVGVVGEQAGVSADQRTLLVAPTWVRQTWQPPVATFVNPLDRLDERIMQTPLGDVVRSASVVVLAVGVAMGGPFEPAREHSNLIAFAFAAGRTIMVIGTDGLMAPFEEFFHAKVHDVNGLRVYANLLLSSREANALVAAADRAPHGEQVEIGRFTGGSTLLLAAAARRGGRAAVHSIDIEHKPVVDYLVDRHGLQRHVWLHQGDSCAVAQSWRAGRPTGDIGFLFIDGDHRYDAVAADILHWTPLVVTGGVVALHDANLPGMEVNRAAYHHLPSSAWKKTAQAGSLLLYERRAV